MEKHSGGVLTRPMINSKKIERQCIKNKEKILYKQETNVLPEDKNI